MNELQYDTMSSEYGKAFKSIKAAKNLFWWLIALSLVVQVAAFVLVMFVGLVDPIYVQPTTTQQVAQMSNDTLEAAKTWDNIFRFGLPATKFGAAVSAILLVLTLGLALNVSLLSRLGGAAGFVSSFFWSLILLAAVTPWQQVLGGNYATGALYNYEDLLLAVRSMRPDWGGDPGISLLEQILFWARFVGYPVVTVLVWLMVQFRFGRGYRQMCLSTAVAGNDLTEPSPMG